jgi:hypothetical protein
MSIVVRQDYFSSADEVAKEIEDAGWHPLTMDAKADENTTHWHDFDLAVFYVTRGTLFLTDTETGKVHECTAGTVAQVPARTLHSERHSGYGAILGMSIDPAGVKPPINLPPEALSSE